jgi:hypothetical protein
VEQVDILLEMRQSNIMGGADNWIGRTYEATNNKNNPFTASSIEKDLFFLDYATPLRGFNMNKISGSSFMALNAEVRFPIAKYLYSGQSILISLKTYS